MNTLWVFGDSFAENHTKDLPVVDHQWHRVLAAELGMEMENRGLSCTGLDYTYYHWYQIQDRVKKGDLVVVMLTGIYRRWLVRDNPQCSTPQMLEVADLREIVDAKQQRALLQYFVYLDHITYIPAHFRNWLYSLDSAVRDCGCRVLLIPCFDCVQTLAKAEADRFPRLSIVTDRHVHNVSIKEFVPDQRDAIWIHDGRPNHLLPVNHRILVDKILDWYKNDVPVTLTDGFLESIFDSNASYSPELCVGPTKLKKR